MLINKYSVAVSCPEKQDIFGTAYPVVYSVSNHQALASKQRM